MNVRSLAVAATAVLAAVGAAGCGNTSSALNANGYESGDLMVLASSPDINAAWQANVDRQFTQRTGAKIEWLPGTAPTNLTKLITSRGKPPADVVFLDTPTETQAIQAGLLEKLDRSLLTESGPHLSDQAFANPGYGPAAIVIRLGTCVNTAQIKKAGVTLKGSIDDWFDPALKGHVAIPDISAFYTQAALPAIAENYNVDFANPTPLLNKIAAANPVTFWSSSADVQQALQSGQVWMTPLNDGRCINLGLKGQPISFDPLSLNIKGKAYRYVGLYDTWDLVKNTDKPKLAHAFIDIATNEASMSKLEQDFGYLPARTDLLAKAKADPKLKDMVGDYDPSDLYVPDYRTWFTNDAAKWQDAWNQRFKK